MTVLPNDSQLRFASHQPVPQFLEAIASNQIGDFFSARYLGANEINIMACNHIRANTLVF
ncbi:hypothetical protein FD724_23625 [Nostoc sp. C057]|uniref:hypothetical protein n=1 Tax=Nostoc sp. C057 TaxID=2576903 RepID=UPI001C4B52B4|nr:hypothetical protein [Nostoc sp. C057]QLE50789.1 hypothetical protein FD724_23625 [Nostoc sp. C057]